MKTDGLTDKPTLSYIECLSTLTIKLHTFKVLILLQLCDKTTEEGAGAGWPGAGARWPVPPHCCAPVRGGGASGRGCGGWWQGSTAATPPAAARRVGPGRSPPGWPAPRTALLHTTPQLNCGVQSVFSYGIASSAGATKHIKVDFRRPF